MRHTLMGLWAWVCVAFITGCATTTTIDFTEPEGSALTIKQKDFVFPVAIKLAQKTSHVNPASNGYDVAIDIPDGDVVLKTHGKLYVFEVMLTDVDSLARNYFRIPMEKITSLKNGAAVTIEGFSADGDKLIYRAVLGLKKTESRLPTPL